LEKYLKKIGRIDDSRFFEVTEVQPTSIVLKDSVENFVAKVMALLMEREKGSHVLLDVGLEDFNVTLSETEPAVTVQ